MEVLITFAAEQAGDLILVVASITVGFVLLTFLAVTAIRFIESAFDFSL